MVYSKTFKSKAALSLNGSVNQNTQLKTITVNLPSITFNINRFYPFQQHKRLPQAIQQLGLNYLLDARNSLSGNENTIFKGNIADSLKYGAYQRVPVSTNIYLGKHITWTPSLDLELWTYGQTINRTVLESQPEKINTVYQNGFKPAWDAGISNLLNTKIYTDYIFSKGPFKQIRHVMMPSLIYNFSPDISQSQAYWKTITYNNQPFTYSIFEKSILGGPALGKQNTLYLDLQNTLEAKRIKTTDTGRTETKIPLIQNLRVSSSYNFSADSFKLSNVIVSARTMVFKNINLVAGLELDPYAYTSEQIRTQTLCWKAQENPRIKTVNVALNTNLNPSIKNTQGVLTQPQWNMNLGLNINSSQTTEGLITRTYATVNAEFKPTPNWRFNLLTGYDFYLKQRSYTTLRVYRDLNCWEASLFWVPFGINQSYNFAINIKSSMFSELKINRQRSWYDAF